MQPTVSNKSLLKATIIALVISAIALVTIILPSEYNIDPTGIGEKLGLTVLSQSQTEENSETMTEQSSDTNAQSKVIEVTVPAGRGIEYKFDMEKYSKLKYEWMTDGQSLYFDLHGEPEGDTTGYFESYVIATNAEMKGSFTAPFAGSHGWYWKNNSDQDVAIQLIVEGEFEVIGLKQ
ncbi:MULTISPECIES: hypothetical protein [Kangiella]|uniref:Uncharacterized protein n=1 Tax=Kangiella profundi TaxID=1561924 RepID=A0A2K9A4Q7_9GAMM|nr:MULTISPECIES: hypothetical protein [Kangiella]AUD78825.1 hypothetical protein CW740_05970 [Kangiella profundi]MBD3653914.1 hypothetical protein [Kangiella sp.]GGF03851.1 hypothetical protein GCM10011356_16970 [Kangiella profundi]